MADNEQAKSVIKEKLDGINDRAKTAESRIDEYFAAPKVDEKQPEPMPSSNQTPEVKPEVETKPEVSAEVDQEREALENSKNPERTKAYIEKLKLERDEALKKTQEPQLPPIDYGRSVLDGIRPTVETTPEQLPQIPQPQQVPNQLPQTPYLNPLQVQNFTQQFVDSQGNVDVDGLNRALVQANRAAYEANMRVQAAEIKIAQIEQSSEERELHARYPEIDPIGGKEKFKPELFNAVRDRLVRNMWEGKKQKTADVVAEIIAERAPRVNPQQVEEQAVEKYKAAQQARNQGPFESGSAGERPSADLGELRNLTRRGGQKGDQALSERLKALGI